MEEISKVLKIVIEKHLIPAVSAVVLMLVSIAVLPSDYWLIEKLGIDWFRVLLFGIFFLLCELIRFLFQVVPKRIAQRIAKKGLLAEKKKEAIKSWQTLFDNLTQYELKIIKELAENGNQPIEKECIYGIGVHSNFLLNRYRSMPWGGSPILGGDDFQNDVYICTTKYVETESAEREARMVYKLQDEAYKAAKYILDTSGRLSTYEEVQ